MRDLAVIFDLDGTIIDNIEYHKKAWFTFLKNHNISITERDYIRLFGKHNRAILNHFFGNQLTKSELKHFASEKEKLYRDIYKPHIKPQKGLISLLDDLKFNKIRTAIATSAPVENLEFVLDELKLSESFDHLSHAGHISMSKPDPEIFLLTAEKLKVKPENCVVFEDSISGIEAAINAGMNVIGINVINQDTVKDMVVKLIGNFEEIDVNNLISIVKK